MASGYMVPTTILVVTGMSEAALILDKKPPSMRPVVGGFIAGLGLYALGALDDHLGVMFCVLLIINALIQHGQTVFTGLKLPKETK